MTVKMLCRNFLHSILILSNTVNKQDNWVPKYPLLGASKIRFCQINYSTE